MITLRCSPHTARLLGMTPISREAAGQLLERRSIHFFIVQDTTGGWWRWQVLDGAYAK